MRQYLGLPRAVYIVCLGTFINRAGSLVVPFLALYFQEALGLGPARASLLVGGYGLGSLIGTAVGGQLADEIGRRPVMIGSLLGTAGMLTALPHLQAVPLLAVAVVLLACVADTYRPAGMAMIADLVEPERRDHAFSLLYVSINLGFSVSPILGGWLAATSYDLLFAVDAGTCALFSLIILLFLRETAPRLTEANTGPPVRWPAAAAHILRHRTYVWFLAATFLMFLVFTQHLAALPLFMSSLGIGTATFGQVMAVNGILIVLIQLPMTALLSRFHRGWMIVLSAVLVGLGFGLTSIALLPWHFVLTVVVWTLGEIIQAPLMNATVTDLAPPQLRARYLGAWGMTFSAAVFLGAPLGGAGLGQLGGPVLWLVAAGVAGGSALIYFGVRRELARAPLGSVDAV